MIPIAESSPVGDTGMQNTAPPGSADDTAKNPTLQPPVLVVSDGDASGPQSSGSGLAPAIDDPDEEMLTLLMRMSPEDLAIMMFEFAGGTADTYVGGFKAYLKASADRQNTANKKHIDATEKARLESEKAAKDGVLGKIFGWIAQVFNIIAQVLGIVAGAILTGATGVGGAVLAVQITALFMTLMDVANAISQECGGPDISIGALCECIAKMCGASAEEAAWLKTAVNIAVTVILIVATIVAAKIDANALKNLATKSGTALKDVLAKVEKATSMLTSVSLYSSVFAGANKMAAGGVAISKAAHEFAEEMCKIESKKLTALIDRLEKLIDHWSQEMLNVISFSNQCNLNACQQVQKSFETFKQCQGQNYG